MTTSLPNPSQREQWIQVRDTLREMTARPDFDFTVADHPITTWHHLVSVIGDLKQDIDFRDDAAPGKESKLGGVSLLTQAEGDAEYLTSPTSDPAWPAVDLAFYNQEGDWNDPAAWDRVSYADSLPDFALTYLLDYTDCRGGAFKREQPLSAAEQEPLSKHIGETRTLGAMTIFRGQGIVVISQPPRKEIRHYGLRILLSAESNDEDVQASVGELLLSCRPSFNPREYPCGSAGGSLIRVN